MKLSRLELGEMAVLLTGPAVSTKATLVEAVAAIATAEAFALALAGQQVNLEHVERRARALIQAEAPIELAEADQAVDLVRAAYALAHGGARA